MRKLSAVTDRLLSRFLDGGTARAEIERCIPDPDDPNCVICTVYENGVPIIIRRICRNTTRG